MRFYLKHAIALSRINCQGNDTHSSAADPRCFLFFYVNITQEFTAPLITLFFFLFSLILVYTKSFARVLYMYVSVYT